MEGVGGKDIYLLELSCLGRSQILTIDAINSFAAPNFS